MNENSMRKPGACDVGNGMEGENTGEMSVLRQGARFRPRRNLTFNQRSREMHGPTSNGHVARRQQRDRSIARFVLPPREGEVDD